jgi:5,10-methylenetetrahydrofolate reductase
MRLREALQKKKFVVTSELQSPVEQGAEPLIKSLETVRGRVDGLSISEVEIAGVVGDTLKACQALKENRFEPIYQTATRNKNRLQLQRDLFQAHESGIENLLVFTEDYRITGDSLQEMMFFHVDAGKLASVLENMREGRTVDGLSLPGKAEFVLGSGVESGWGKNVPELEMKELDQMTRLGTGYFLTTPVFDLEVFEKFLARVQTFGVPVVAEVMILRSAGMAQFLNRHLKPGLVPNRIIQRLASAPDRLKASIDVFAETVSGLKDLCQGIHIITMGAEDRLRHYLDAARLK